MIDLGNPTWELDPDTGLYYPVYRSTVYEDHPPLYLESDTAWSLFPQDSGPVHTSSSVAERYVVQNGVLVLAPGESYQTPMMPFPSVDLRPFEEALAGASRQWADLFNYQFCRSILTGLHEPERQQVIFWDEPMPEIPTAPSAANGFVGVNWDTPLDGPRPTSLDTEGFDELVSRLRGEMLWRPEFPSATEEETAMVTAGGDEPEALPDADTEVPAFAKPLAPLADWMKRAEDLIEEVKK